MKLRDWFRIEDCSTTTLRATLRTLPKSRLTRRLRERIDAEICAREIDEAIEATLARAEDEDGVAFPVVTTGGWN